MATITHTDAVAKDGVKHQPSTDPSVHRPLIVVDPPMAGRDVANLQRATRARLKARGLADDVPVPEHGRFSLGTALACIEAQYFLGLRSDTYMMRDRHGHRVLTEGAQEVIRHPGRRDAKQLQRAKDRRAQVKRGPRFYDRLAGELGIRGRGADDALRFAMSKVGISERPPGSNSGPQIDDWCRLAGYDGPVPWCGCFVNACIVAGGVPSGAGWIGSTVRILQNARRGRHGFTFHTVGMPGDLALYDDGPRGDPVVHVEIVLHRIDATTYATIGGNTSSSNGSQADGGMVARHDDRSTRGGFHIIGFARPPYPRG